jgi:hypothetical protein
MKKLLGPAMIAAVLVTLGPTSANGQGGKPPKLAAVPLSVIVDDDTAMRITGDGLPYEHGVAGTQANIDQYGHLIILFGRGVSFDYGTTTAGVPPSGSFSGSYISTLNFSGRIDTGLPLQRMEAGTSQCIQLNWQFTDASGVLWRNGFHRDRDLPDQDGTSFAVVTYEGGGVWTVEPRTFTCPSSSDEGPYTNPANQARVFSQTKYRAGWVYTDAGMHTLPFRLVLTAK